MIKAILAILSFLVGVILTGKGKQITINRKNKVITTLKQERSNLKAEVTQYKTAHEVVAEVSDTKKKFNEKKQEILASIANISPSSEQLQNEGPSPDTAHEEDSPLPDGETISEGENIPENKEETDEREVLDIASDQSVRTHRIADIMR